MLGIGAAFGGLSLLGSKKTKRNKVSLYQLLASSRIAEPLSGVSGGERVKRAEKLFETVRRAGYPDSVGLAAIVDADETTQFLTPSDRSKVKRLLKERAVSVVGSHFQGNSLATICGMYGLRVRRGGMRAMIANTQRCRVLFPDVCDVPGIDLKVSK